MTVIKIKGYEVDSFDMKHASSRKALQLKNAIVSHLRKLGIHEDAVSVKEEPLVIRRTAASVSWYMDGRYLYYDYKTKSFMENLYIVSKIIENEVEAVLTGEKDREEFVAAFSESDDVEAQRREARATLGVNEDSSDMDLINKRYKDLAKEHHPDIGGDVEMFQRINAAHKTLRRELA